MAGLAKAVRIFEDMWVAILAKAVRIFEDIWVAVLAKAVRILEDIWVAVLAKVAAGQIHEGRCVRTAPGQIHYGFAAPVYMLAAWLRFLAKGRAVYCFTVDAVKCRKAKPVRTRLVKTNL